ncbi:MAG: TRAP transporter fused permease subunit [Desulfobacterales bacterium]|nr:TRAP transporter fused permease subunit [Desulfobacterales bacterium]
MSAADQNASDPGPKVRMPAGVTGMVAKTTLGIIPVIGTVYVTHIPEYLNIAIYKEQYMGLVLSLLLIATYLTIPASSAASREKVPWYDVVFIVGTMITGGYIVFFYPEIIPTLGYLMPHRIVMGAVMILLVLEAARRLTGWPIVTIGIVLIFYSAYAYLLPGVLNARKIPWSRVLTSLYLSPGSLLGIPLGIVGTIVFSFIFFGRLLFSVGGGKFLSDVALSMMGRYRGGPAKVAIVASSLFGTLSGSASANVAMTGIITIPLMKKIGYKPHMAAAIEAVASTGGLLMPPIMAATAFIMAEFLDVSYSTVATSAFIPALLYYVAIFVQVHLEAIKGGFQGLPPEEVPSLKIVMKNGWVFFIPAAVLLYCMFVLFLPPSTSALFAVAATMIVSLFRKSTRTIVTRNIWTILEDTGRGLLDIGIVCSVAGLVIGSISLTGLGLSLSDALVTLSGGNVLLLLFLAAVGAIILGMGMPVTATYIMLVVLIAPALIRLGVEPLAAHLFIMYFGVMSFLTPPVAIAAYVAASIAHAEPLQTGFTGVRLGIIAYVVPFIFALSPSLILIGTTGEILLTITTALLGTLFLSVAFVGYLFDRLAIITRVCFAIGAFGFITSSPAGGIIGLLFITPLFLLELHRKKQRRRNTL